MVSDDRYCIDILTQISAAQAALDKVALELLDGHAHTCVIGAEPGHQDARTEEMMAAVGRLLKRGRRRPVSRRCWTSRSSGVARYARVGALSTGRRGPSRLSGCAW